jgi:cyanophycinase
MTRRLYLLGGSLAFDVTAADFIPAAGGQNARIALLLQGGMNWKKYVSEYVQPWQARGVSCIDVIVPDESGRLDLDDIVKRLENATGIFIGGGNTGVYRRLYASDPMRALLRKQYERGVPIAGCSAGALIAPKVCAFYPSEGDVEGPTAEGLGLIDNLLVGVHFSAKGSLQHLVPVMTGTRTRVAWGIEEGACVVFEEQLFGRVLGHSAFEIVITDFEKGKYDVLEHPIP